MSKRPGYPVVAAAELANEIDRAIIARSVYVADSLAQTAKSASCTTP